MGSAFGTYGGKGLIAPASIMGLPQGTAKPANWFEAKIGAEPGRGSVLMSGEDILSLQQGNGYTLVFGVGDDSVSFPNVYFSKAWRLVSTGYDDDPDAIYVVELEDVRSVVRLGFINEQYNVRTVNTDSGDIVDPDDYIESTTKYLGGDAYEPWDYEGMLGDVWSNTPSVAGAVPSIPAGVAESSETPENFRFVTMRAIEAADEIARRMGLNFWYDPVSQTFRFSIAGEADTAYESTSSSAANSKTHSHSTRYPTKRTAVPEKVKVCFPIFYEDQLTDDIIERPYYVTDYTLAQYNTFAGTSFVPIATGTLDHIFDDMEGHDNSAGSITNITAVNDRTIERGKEYYRALLNMRLETERYNGVWSFLPGERVGRVVWEDAGGGFTTTVHFVGPPKWGKRELKPPRGGGVTVLGPCATYTPDEVDEPDDTDFAIDYPGGCLGPNRLGLNVKNVVTNVVTIVELFFETDTPDLLLSSDDFTLSCKSSTVSVYAKLTFESLDIEGVLLKLYKASDDSLYAEFWNTQQSWFPEQGGKLQFGPTNIPCDCGTLPFDLCISVPTR
jgi:hypothetical protein